MRVLRILLPALLALTAPAGAQTAAETSFAATVARLSEPGGYFDTDNLISNEASYLHVMGGLRELEPKRGVYLGVGPDQNFSYIAALRPELALIVDVRRDNLLHHLLLKAIFELSRDRAEYLAMLLGRAAPDHRSPDAPIESLVAHYDSLAFDPSRLSQTSRRIHRRIDSYGIPLEESDRATIDRFHASFARAGLDLRFQTHGRAPQYDYPTLRDLVLERDLDGIRASYLASDEAFQVVRGLQLRGGIVPVVGDLAGSFALPSIAALLTERGLRVSAYYTSNVEFYLSRQGRLDEFVENVRRLPRGPGAVIIRSLFRTPHPRSVPGYGSTQLLQPIDTLLTAWDDGRIGGYLDLVLVGTVEVR